MNQNPVECYVVSNRGHFMNATPAKVVRETLSTITAQRIGEVAYESTFQKSKRWQEGYEDPRKLYNYEYGLRSRLPMRGSKWGSTHLSFDIERVEEQLRTENVQKDLLERLKKVEAAATKFFYDNRHADVDNEAFKFTLNRLESVFPSTKV